MNIKSNNVASPATNAHRYVFTTDNNWDELPTTVIQAADVDVQNLSRMYYAEVDKSAKLELEVKRLTQNYMHMLKLDDDVKYWQHKWVQLKVENAVLTHDIKELTEDIRLNDSKQTDSQQDSIECLTERHLSTVTALQQAFEARIADLEADVAAKDETIACLTSTVETLTSKLSCQADEETIIKHILSLPDQASMLRFMYTAQVMVNSKIFDSSVWTRQFEPADNTNLVARHDEASESLHWVHSQAAKSSPRLQCSDDASDVHNSADAANALHISSQTVSNQHATDESKCEVERED